MTYARPIPARPLWGGHFRSGPWLGQAPGPAVRCCPNPNAPPGQEMPCYDAQGNLVYYTDSKHSYGQCSMPTAPPPQNGGGAPPSVTPSGPAPATPVEELPNVVTQSPPANVTFPIANLSFPADMDEPPLQKFTKLPAGSSARLQMLSMVVGPTTVYPQRAKPIAAMTHQGPIPAQVLQQPPGTAVPLSDYFRWP